MGIGVDTAKFVLLKKIGEKGPLSVEDIVEMVKGGSLDPSVLNVYPSLEFNELIKRFGTNSHERFHLTDLGKKRLGILLIGKKNGFRKNVKEDTEPEIPLDGIRIKESSFVLLKKLISSKKVRFFTEDILKLKGIETTGRFGQLAGELVENDILFKKEDKSKKFYYILNTNLAKPIYRYKNSVEVETIYINNAV